MSHNSIKTAKELENIISPFNCKWVEMPDYYYQHRLARCLNCKHEFLISGLKIKSRKSKSICSKCKGKPIPKNHGGFKKNYSGIVYLLKDRKGAIKVGITNTDPYSPDGRIARHSKNGWKLVEIWRFANGEVAYQIEQAFIKWLREDLSLPAAYEGIDGWTETFDQKHVSIEKASAKIEELIRVFDLVPVYN